MNFFLPLLRLDFWFALVPDFMSPFFQTSFFLLFALLLLFGAVLRIVSRQKKYDVYTRNTFVKVGTMLLTMGALGFLWLFFSLEGVYFLGARFWFLVWVVGFVAWIVSIRRYVVRDVPALKARQQSRAEANKYLPRRSR